MRREKLDHILSNSKGERDVAKFLASNPQIVRWAICHTGGHSTYVLKEFPFGSRYKADLVVAWSHSGAWEIEMIELEPPEDHVINKDGTVSQRFNKALTQVSEWEEYIEKNRQSIREDLARFCMKKDLLGQEDPNDRPCNYSADYLDSPDTFIRYNFHIAIGKRESIDKEKRNRINQQIRNHALRVFTYGRFQDIASNLDKADKRLPHESVNLTESKE